MLRKAPGSLDSRFGRARGFAERRPPFVSAFGLKPYRLEQLYRASVKELIENPSGVTTLPKELRAQFAESGVAFSSVRPVLEQRSADGQTTKVVLALRDGKEVESVLMEHHGARTTICISSQAGCAFACTFCSTGQAGFSRHLTPVEIVDQVLYSSRASCANGAKHILSQRRGSWGWANPFTTTMP